MELRRRRDLHFRDDLEGAAKWHACFWQPNTEGSIWALAAYVRSIAGLAPQDAAPNRDDAFLTRTPESFMDSQKPETEKPSSASGRPQ